MSFGSLYIFILFSAVGSPRAPDVNLPTQGRHIPDKEVESNTELSEGNDQKPSILTIKEATILKHDPFIEPDAETKDIFENSLAEPLQQNKFSDSKTNKQNLIESSESDHLIKM